jgi:hypothetical protein
LHFHICDDEAGFQEFVDSTIKRIKSGTRTARDHPLASVQAFSFGAEAEALGG